ncbi:MAG TPA: amidohydrolase [Caldisericia bacterium]|nr:amidohydrolase [Caldisericia bacterium]
MLSPVELRHWMQAHPELAFHERGVTDLLCRELSFLKGLSLLRPLETGLVAVYEKLPGKPFTLFRADLDALPVRDEISGELVAKHVCGHDLHTAILYGLILRTLEEAFRGNILFVFQPAEEAGGGAKKLLDSGVFDSFSVDSAYAMHVSDAFPLGVVASARPTLFSSSQELDLHWRGCQSHITQPEKGRDVWKACVALEQWKTCCLEGKEDGFFLGIGQVEAGTVRNCVPEKAVMRMTARGKTTEILRRGLEKVQQAVREIELEHGVEATLSYGTFYPAVEQNESLARHWMKEFGKQGKAVVCDPVWAAEDFGYFAQRFPAWMFWLGTRLPEEPELGLHHRSFCPSDVIIPLGIHLLSHLSQRDGGVDSLSSSC